MSTYFFTREHRPVQRKIVRRRLAANTTDAGTDANKIVLKAGSSLRRVYLHNRTANAVTGGVRIGTAAGGAQALAATAVAANALVDVPVAAPLLSKTDQTLFVEAVTAWNNAQVDIVIEYLQVPFVETEYQPGSLNVDPTLVR